MSKKTLNQPNLEALGAEQLAALLLEVSAGSADIKRRLRLELSHNLGAEELAHDVRKRLAALRKSTSYVGWRKRKALIKDLETQVMMIVEKVGPNDPTVAFNLLWEFIEIAPSIYGRVDDSKGDVGAVFDVAVGHFEDLGPRAQLDPVALADRMWLGIQDNAFGEWDGIIPLMAPALGAAGLSRLEANVQAYATKAVMPVSHDHEAIQFLRQLRGGDSYAADKKSRFVRMCLQEIAQASGDHHAYIAQYSEEELQTKSIAAEVAILMMEDGQAEEALRILDDAEHFDGGTQDGEWDTAYIACLKDLGRVDDAQTHRWRCFSQSLDHVHLRDYLKGLPDFEDVEAEDRARKYALDFPSFAAALHFCMRWPDLLTAADLIAVRGDEINGDLYDLLTPAADSLRARHPLAAVTLWRAMIDHALELNLAFRFAAAAEFLTDCAAIDAEIEVYGKLPNHARYLQTLQAQYERRTVFWTKAAKVN